jgi:hypothetical protein
MTPTRSTSQAYAATPTRLSLLDIVIARHARAHDQHVSPLLGCYLCLMGTQRGLRSMQAAA